MSMLDTCIALHSIHLFTTTGDACKGEIRESAFQELLIDWEFSIHKTTLGKTIGNPQSLALILLLRSGGYYIAE